jgi:hypothetical protein
MQLGINIHTTEINALRGMTPMQSGAAGGGIGATGGSGSAVGSGGFGGNTFGGNMHN